MPTLFDPPPEPMHEKRQQRIHPNSRATYKDERGKLSKRALLILRHIQQHGGGTDRRIAKDMGFEHRSAVQPRISELIKAELLIESKTVKCPVTGKRVRFVNLNNADSNL